MENFEQKLTPKELEDRKTHKEMKDDQIRKELSERYNQDKYDKYGTAPNDMTWLRAEIFHTVMNKIRSPLGNDCSDRMRYLLSYIEFMNKNLLNNMIDLNPFNITTKIPTNKSDDNLERHRLLRSEIGSQMAVYLQPPESVVGVTPDTKCVARIAFREGSPLLGALVEVVGNENVYSVSSEVTQNTLHTLHAKLLSNLLVLAIQYTLFFKVRFPSSGKISWHDENGGEISILTGRSTTDAQGTRKEKEVFDWTTAVDFLEKLANGSVLKFLNSVEQTLGVNSDTIFYWNKLKDWVQKCSPSGNFQLTLNSIIAQALSNTPITTASISKKIGFDPSCFVLFIHCIITAAKKIDADVPWFSNNRILMMVKNGSKITPLTLETVQYSLDYFFHLFMTGWFQFQDTKQIILGNEQDLYSLTFNTETQTLKIRASLPEKSSQPRILFLSPFLRLLEFVLKQNKHSNMKPIKEEENEGDEYYSIDFKQLTPRILQEYQVYFSLFTLLLEYYIDIKRQKEDHHGYEDGIGKLFAKVYNKGKNYNTITKILSQLMELLLYYCTDGKDKIDNPKEPTEAAERAPFILENTRRRLIIDAGPLIKRRIEEIGKLPVPKTQVAPVQTFFAPPPAVDEEIRNPVTQEQINMEKSFRH